ncbi:fungal-specific transcription factor domain-domain-containing protein [Clohesyomyces aquaticus]|uniref:Fungal-specific transcription factor domain-domain-containing protein n=1 Tax=Clohesyomyces aquaticus TaxID=1231657 RepID=A0A1Y1YLF6_9PLEO|nr:fungal-specific transcription factor domain-domain-containing protein [Clohesyomyces aquaticus]
MMTRDIVVLQALTIHIACARWQNPRSTWVISGIAIGIAQSMGMHSDSANSDLDIVTAEVRRRIWWTLFHLDRGAADYCGLEPHVVLTMDTRLPLHIDDSDLLSATTTKITPANRLTEMTASLMKIEFGQFILKFKHSRQGFFTLKDDEIEREARDMVRRYEETYLTYWTGSSNLHSLGRLGVRLFQNKLWKIAHDVSQDSRDPGPETINETLLFYNADILEITYQFPGIEGPYGWPCRCKYSSWHAMAYLLIELCKYTQGPAMARAWSVLDAVMGGLDQDGWKEKNRVLWPPLLRLYRRARNLRQQALRNGQEQNSTRSTVQTSHSDKTAPISTEIPLVLPKNAPSDDEMLEQAIGSVEDVNWEELDKWVEDFKADLS